MRLEAHIHDARCASCHAKIDPLGLAFDNYDAIGRYRTEEVLTDGQGNVLATVPVDTAAVSRKGYLTKQGGRDRKSVV